MTLIFYLPVFFTWQSLQTFPTNDASPSHSDTLVHTHTSIKQNIYQLEWSSSKNTLYYTKLQNISESFSLYQIGGNGDGNGQREGEGFVSFPDEAINWDWYVNVTLVVKLNSGSP